MLLLLQNLNVLHRMKKFKNSVASIYNRKQNNITMRFHNIFSLYYLEWADALAPPIRLCAGIFTYKPRNCGKNNKEFQDFVL